MEQFALLFLLTLSMATGSYISGTIPLVFNLSEGKIRVLTVFGAGILVGTSLAVIIPEGVNTLYESAHTFSRIQREQHHQPRRERDADKILDAMRPLGDEGPEPTAPPGRSSNNNDEDDKIDKDEIPHSMIGYALVSGFVFMLFVDQFASRHSNGHAAASYSPTATDENEQNHLKRGANNSDPSSVIINSTTTTAAAATDTNPSRRPPHRRRSAVKITATIGLIVHAAADGVALGAAATTAHSDVEMIVFLAILLHKAPAAFGLVTFLLHEGLDKHRIRRHLIAFSLSAPLAAFLTYFLISLSSAGSALTSEYNTTGMAMLFSAGTFLYVAAVHVLPEITHHKELKVSELLTLVAGAFLPSILTINHHH